MTYGYSSRRFGFAEQLRKDWMSDFSKDVRRQRRKEHPFGADKGFTPVGSSPTSTRLRSGSSVFGQGWHEVSAGHCGNPVMTMRRRQGKPKGKHFRFTNRMGFPFEQFYCHHTSKKQKVFGFTV